MNNGSLQHRAFLLEGFNRRPSLLSEEAAAILMSSIMSSMMGTPPQAVRKSMREESVEAMRGSYGLSEYTDAGVLVSNGIAYIPMHGTLVNRRGNDWFGTTGYDDIREQFDTALASDRVEGIIFDINSGGGMVYGNFELADYIHSRRDEKPMMGVVNAVAASGAYSLASALPKLVSTASGDTGSIGVVTMHADVSKALEKFGVDINFIFAGDHKVDGNMFEPLSADVRESMQARIDGMYSKFVSLVAKNRGISTESVRATQARVFQAAEAMSLGLIDAVMTPHEAVAAFTTGSMSGLTISAERRNEMSNTNNTQSPAAANPVAPATVADEPVASATAAPTQPDERARIKGIVTCEEADGRRELAEHFAYDTSMSVEEARTALAKSPKLAAAVPQTDAASALESAMAQTGGGADVPNDNAEGAAASQQNGSRLMASLAMARGDTPTK